MNETHAQEQVCPVHDPEQAALNSEIGEHGNGL
jgi:hypothetical protein